MSAANTEIAIEDGFEDVVGKAVRGYGIATGVLEFLSEVEESKIESFLDGNWDRSVAEKLGPFMGLHVDALEKVAQGKYAPAAVEVTGLLQFHTMYDDMGVNAYVVFDPESKEAAIFDTGADVAPMLDAIEQHQLQVKQIFLTHTHVDHIACLGQLRERFPEAKVHANAWEQVVGAATFAYGDHFKIGSLRVETKRTTGHSPGGTTFVVEGLSQPVAIVGDAIFAGSMGGGLVSFREAIMTNRENLFTLNEATVCCPGHGPMTTIGEEKANNPFFPEFKS